MLKNEKLAAALIVLSEKQKESNVLRSDDFTREQRELLESSGFISLACNGWYYSSNPSVSFGDTTPWMSSFWNFVSQYCNERFKNNWYLGTDDSLSWHTYERTIPRQTIIYTKDKTDKMVELPFKTSIFPIQERNFLGEDEIQNIDGINVLRLETALSKASSSFYKKYPNEAAQLLNQIDINMFAGICADGNKVRYSGRVIGALRHINLNDKANEISRLLLSVHVRPKEENPFENEPAPIILPSNAVHPFSVKLVSMWASMRDDVLEYSPKNKNKYSVEKYMQNVDDIYVTDAYNSLSIEGYQVTPELIREVSNGNWNPEKDDKNKKELNALAAFGYYKAFRKVREAVESVQKGGDAKTLSVNNFESWRHSLFEPAVQVGLIKDSDLLGFRRGPVLISNSRHIPPNYTLVYGAIEQWKNLLMNEPDPFVQAVLGHYMLGYIHPFSDGNGRTSRFLMNCLLSGGNYPWTVIKNSDRRIYVSALEKGSVEGDITDFASFVGTEVNKTIESIDNTKDRTETKHNKRKGLKPS